MPEHREDTGTSAAEFHDVRPVSQEGSRTDGSVVWGENVKKGGIVPALCLCKKTPRRLRRGAASLWVPKSKSGLSPALNYFFFLAVFFAAFFFAGMNCLLEPSPSKVEIWVPYSNRTLQLA